MPARPRQLILWWRLGRALTHDPWTFSQTLEEWMASQTAEVTSRVLALPPRSGV
jgi:hypothetical protein